MLIGRFVGELTEDFVGVPVGSLVDFLVTGGFVGINVGMPVGELFDSNRLPVEEALIG